MRELGIDIETYSGYDLAKCGVYRYVEHPDFTVLLFAYSVDGGPVSCVDIASGEQLPAEILWALTDPSVTKTAYNAAFERICIGRWLGVDRRLDPSQWRCTMVRASRLGLPSGLGICAKTLKLSATKMDEGKDLIRLFSKPDRKGLRHTPQTDPEKWEVFKAYCIRDVEVEQAILAKVRRLDVPAFDDELYVADQEINDQGVLVDRRLVDCAARLDAEYKAALLDEAKELTGMENPNSPVQIKEYLRQATGQRVDSLTKKDLDELSDRLKLWPTARRVLEIRRELGKTSNAKYNALQACLCDDGRAHGLLQFYGSRTGRWAGRLVQVQNLPQNHIKGIGRARSMAKAGDLDDFELNYPDVTQTLSELIRTAFVAPEGQTLHVCDFSAIEARVIAWLAGERWVLDVFRQGGDVYCATASQMFGVPVEKHGRNSHLRQKGKIAVLALGYGGGVSALEAMGGKRLGLAEGEMKEIVRLWRKSNKSIVRLWADVEESAIDAVNIGVPRVTFRGITMNRRWGALTITLPSGRTLCYPRARVGIETGDGWRGDREIIEYEGLNQTTKKWETVRTYGGKLVENIVQAIARDILGWVILRARRKGYRIVFHVHDEIVVEADNSVGLKDIEALFREPIPWCRDLPLTGAGYSTPYYLKD